MANAVDSAQADGYMPDGGATAELLLKTSGQPVSASNSYSKVKVRVNDTAPTSDLNRQVSALEKVVQLMNADCPNGPPGPRVPLRYCRQ